MCANSAFLFSQTRSINGAAINQNSALKPAARLHNRFGASKAKVAPAASQSSARPGINVSVGIARPILRERGTGAARAARRVVSWLMGKVVSSMSVLRDRTCTGWNAAVSWAATAKTPARSCVRYLPESTETAWKTTAIFTMR